MVEKQCRHFFTHTSQKTKNKTKTKTNQHKNCQFSSYIPKSENDPWMPPLEKKKKNVKGPKLASLVL